VAVLYSNEASPSQVHKEIIAFSGTFFVIILHILRIDAKQKALYTGSLIFQKDKKWH
jgi:hypothetical protein